MYTALREMRRFDRTSSSARIIREVHTENAVVLAYRISKTRVNPFTLKSR